MSEGDRKGGKRVVEHSSNREVGEGGGEVVGALVEGGVKREVVETEGKLP